MRWWIWILYYNIILLTKFEFYCKEFFHVFIEVLLKFFIEIFIEAFIGVSYRVFLPFFELFILIFYILTSTFKLHSYVNVSSFWSQMFFKKCMFYFSILILLWILLRSQKMLCIILCKFSHVFILHAIPKNFHAFLSKFFWSFHRGFIEVFIDVCLLIFKVFFIFYTSIIHLYINVE